MPRRFMKGIIRDFNLSPLPESARPEKKIVKFPRTPTGSGSLIRRREQNESNDNSASQLLFQVRLLNPTLLGAVADVLNFCLP